MIGAFGPLVIMIIIVFIFFTVTKTGSGRRIKIGGYKLVAAYFSILTLSVLIYPFVIDGVTKVEGEDMWESHVTDEASTQKVLNNLDRLYVIKEEEIALPGKTYKTESYYDMYSASWFFIEKTDELEDKMVVTYYETENEKIDILELIPFPKVSATSDSIFVSLEDVSLYFRLMSKEFIVTAMTGEDERFISGYRAIQPIENRVIYIKVPADVEIERNDSLNLHIIGE